jgi:hypothetical protein
MISLNASLTPFLIHLAQVPGQQGAPEPVPLPHPEIPPPVELAPGLSFGFTLAAILVTLMLVVFVIWLLFKPKPIEVPPPIVPLKIALRALKDLKHRVGELPPPESSHQVSEILRSYFLQRYGVPAPFRTTPELFDGQPSNDMRSAWKQRFGPLATIYDEIAFAPLPATTAQATSLIESAISKLEEERP